MADPKAVEINFYPMLSYSTVNHSLKLFLRVFLPWCDAFMHLRDPSLKRLGILLEFAKFEHKLRPCVNIYKKKYEELNEVNLYCCRKLILKIVKE